MKKPIKKQRLIIETWDVPFEEALPYVKAVLIRGKVSEARNIKHYCWITVFGDVVVTTRKKKKESSADSLVVYKKKK